MSVINNRQYQVESIQSLRNGFKEGHVRQVLAAPTGAGKSVIMLDMIRKAVDKGSRVMFICERRILVEQFSKHLDAAGIGHGVLMAKHWRFRPYELVQVASAQTLEKMESLPVFDICFVDELHAALRASIINLITTRPTLKIIGATATPFNPKIATHFSKVTCVTTMRQLVDDGYLVPFRVFVAREIDTKGLKVVAGEWQKDELEKRGQQIVGDVVADYVRISNEVFGGYRKTICFSCGIAHGADLAKKFNEVGINAVQISSNDDEEYRAEVLSDFAKPESDIKVVISVAILSRGFDQSDVDYVILARPLKKSFSEHVQMVGRGARIHPGKELCIASGQRVLTHRGLVAIEEVSIYDKLWDGISFVSHKGVIFKGFKNVITYQGLTATSDHLVKTKEGWRTFGDCSSEQIPIVQTGLGRSPIRESENIFSRSGVARETLAETDVRPLRMSNMLQKVFNFIQQFISRDSRRLRQMQPTKDHHQQNGSSEGCSAKAALYKSEKYSLSRLRWSGNYVQVRQCFGWLFMGHGELATTSRFDQISTGSDRQRKTLRAWESEVGNQLIQLVAHAKANVKCAFAFIQNHILANTLRRQHTKNSFWNGFERHTNHRKIPQAVQQTQRQVWDILDSGPRNCFTCEGLLVHNCVIQDNSGNWLRFQDSWETLYNDGVTELTGEQDKKSRKEPSDKEKKEAKCPKCAVVWVGNTDVCSHCGHVRERKNDVVAVAGEMFELGQSVKKEKYTAEQKASWYAQLLGYAEEKGHNLGSAYYRYKEKFGVAPSMAKPKPIGAGLEVRNWITSRNIANAKRKSK